MSYSHGVCSCCQPCPTCGLMGTNCTDEVCWPPVEGRDECSCPNGGGHNGYSSLACSWEQWISCLPVGHPKRVQHEAGGEALDWEDSNYNGEPCRCACHDGEDW